MNYSKLSELIKDTPNSLLNKQVSLSTINYSEVVDLTKKLLPDVLTGIKNWQTQNARLCINMTITDKGNK